MYKFGLLLLLGIATITGGSADSSNPAQMDWPAVDAATVDFIGFQRSRTIPLPEFSPVKPHEIVERAKAAGDLAIYPDASAVILFSHDRTGFDSGGYYHLVQEEAVKILTPKGVEDYGVVRLNYDIPYDRTRVLEAFVIQPDGRITHITPDDISDVSNSEDMDANIFEPIWRSILIRYPGVTSGSIVYWAYENVSIKPRSEGAFQWGHTFRSSLPIREASIHLLGPSSVSLKWAVANNRTDLVSFKQSDRADGNTLYQWWSGPAEMIEGEPHMIPVQELTTSLHVSSDTWRSYSARESVYIEPNLVPDDLIRAKVGELTAGIDDIEAKMEALFLYVTRKVRYMGVTFGDRPGVNPDPVTRTFGNNAGVCKDKAGLLTAMLRLAGIEAWYTLNNPEARIFQEVAVDQFNHAIVAARLPGETTWRYLDVTVDLAPTMMPSSSGGTQALRITPDGAELDTIPIDSPETNTATITAHSRLEPDGSLSSQVNYIGIGAADHFYREYLYYLDRTQRGSLFTYLVSTLSSSAKITNWKVAPEPVDDLENPIDISFDYVIPEYAVPADNYMLLRFPCSQSPFDWFWSDIWEVAGLRERQYPVNIGIPSRTVSRETLQLPVGYKPVAIPDPVTIESTWLTFVQSWSSDQTAMTLEQTFIVHHPRVAPEDYAGFHDAYSRIREAMQSYIIMEKIR